MMELDIEPDDVSTLTRLDDAPALGRFMPDNFPLLTLLRFVPDVRLKQRVEQVATAALAIDVTADGGIAKADVALADLLRAIDDAYQPFADPTGLANQLHKRLTGLRTDFVAAGVTATETLKKRIYAETKRRDQIAEQERRRLQEKADAEARAAAEKAAKEANARKAPKDVVDAMKDYAKTAVAPPVGLSRFETLTHNATVEKWKARLVGTADDAEINPAMTVLDAAQQDAARAFFRAVGDGSVPLVCALVNWSEVNARANAERSTFALPGLEAVDVGGVRSKGRR